MREGAVGVGKLGGVAALGLVSFVVQGVVEESSPEGYGLAKWIIALESPGSSGYYTVAKRQMADPSRFLAEYPVWIERQDALHVGTHPPGLFLSAKASLALMESYPGLARWVVNFAPPSTSKAIATYRETHQLSRADAASLGLTGALTMLGCALTVLPLYGLARSSLTAEASWACALLLAAGPVGDPVPADGRYRVPLTLDLRPGPGGLGGDVSRTGRGLIYCILSGSLMALGMFFTLAFLPVGLVVALMLMSHAGAGWRVRAGWILATGLGFVGLTLGWWFLTSANPLAIWWTNQENHARFYVEYRRTYFAWVVENPVELAIALGLPSALWAAVGFGSPGKFGRTAKSRRVRSADRLIDPRIVPDSPESEAETTVRRADPTRQGSLGHPPARKVPRVALATLLVLTFLTLSGKNLSEVARLWLPLMPALLVASGEGFRRLGAGPFALSTSIGLIGLQTWFLERMIQVVYPI